MVKKYQSTLKNAVTFEGYGVHSGNVSVVRIYPADIDSGVIFKRCGIDKSEQILRAHASQIGETELSTTLRSGDVRVETIEHLMAAIAAYGLDNLVIEVSSNEVPILDGSSWQYCQAFEQVGIVQQPALRSYFIVKKPVRTETKSGFAEFLPFDGCRFDVMIDFSSPAIGKQHLSFDLTSQGFLDDLSRARTFGFVKDIEKLWASGKGLGASLENSLVIGLDNQIINPEGMYFDDEFVRHKMLDAIGDTALLGAPFIGLFRSYCSGHALNSQLVKAVLADESCYEKITL
ncbi:UDP-3-O-[3-hydroxymyristoyl] N-acetylglucosamine deacetylase [Bartonella bacilliformis str. Heidi Mejia]|uniref:UDP-3-O-acyl-N-acetylglucosamine deacetylase n=2 Tax=Bartonella bacilliformis TaxID=774 RepID=A1UTB8_BARBK|nr:UDP-3-O-acyl-N-acetylglucosamine deacetylase [Bartonella bacilliformis]ABM45599.1 UDP-3-0-acyl N-acetylglucosamine deacetylase [Bartonella bacilliformis KC583]AMG85992.1 UDP-3-O-acyl-N-acetylglucosamine deacetylase [Bartonella bacilliformis]EKS43481.1 UDP-3-O-[3-hydroxymyristoyl] N-acetylglucosamine deacetylase [Bartonella bacilliformis INS]EYS89691.1 UDP-3-O-[3-hydroxymyristoyl] N-acetylglucosamine deacetylase [Bartonella bacilliformis San Pedro600-02]EYS92630.1 UDP-3-O-[3-hydroxymyristoyl